MTHELRNIPVAEIGESPFALRPCDKEATSYQELVEGIKQKGFIGAITVRTRSENEPEATPFIILDGLQRWNATKDAGLPTIPAMVKDGLSQLEQLQTQCMANATKVETKNAQYAQCLQKMMAIQPTLTKSELATSLGKTPTWVESMLRLNKITNEKIRDLIDEGKIVLSNAWQLCRLPEAEVVDYLQEAQTADTQKFTAEVTKRVKAINEAKREGRKPGKREFSPLAHLRKPAEAKTELESGEVGVNTIAAEKIKTAIDGWKAGLAWMLNLDATAVKIQKAKYDERAAKLAQAAKERKVEKADIAAKKAAENAQKAREAVAEAKG